MKARVATSTLEAALSAVNPAVSNQRPHVMLRFDGGLTLLADNGDVGIEADVETGMLADGDGEVLIQHKPFAAYVAKANAGEVQMEATDEGVEFRCGRSKMHLSAVVSDGFPQRPEVDAEPAVLTGEQWARIRSLMPFAATKDSAGALCGIHISEQGAVANDNLRIAGWQHPFGFETLLPVFAVQAIGDGHEQVTVLADDRGLELHAGTVRLRTSRLAAQYPDVWTPLLAFEPTGTITVSSEQLVDAVALASVLSKDGAVNSKVVCFDISETGFVVESWPDAAAAAKDVIVEELDAEVRDVADRFGIHATHVKPMIDAIGAPDDITIEYTRPGVPLIARGDDAISAIGYIRRTS